MRSNETHDETYQKGIRNRRDVLGAAHVDRSLAQVSEFARPIQEMVTEYVWGDIWSRDGLERKTRSLINIAVLSALNRLNELEVNLRGALNHGVSVDEIQEVLLQVAVYVSAPAALESFRIAETVLGENGAID